MLFKLTIACLLVALSAGKPHSKGSDNVKEEAQHFINTVMKNPNGAVDSDLVIKALEIAQHVSEKDVPTAEEAVDEEKNFRSAHPDGLTTNYLVSASGRRWFAALEVACGTDPSIRNEDEQQKFLHICRYSCTLGQMRHFICPSVQIPV